MKQQLKRNNHKTSGLCRSKLFAATGTQDNEQKKEGAHPECPPSYLHAAAFLHAAASYLACGSLNFLRLHLTTVRQAHLHMRHLSFVVFVESQIARHLL
jgi:hypothetical protein